MEKSRKRKEKNKIIKNRGRKEEDKEKRRKNGRKRIDSFPSNKFLIEIINIRILPLLPHILYLH